MKPGSELDALLAEKVMGWKRETGMLHGKLQEVFTDGEGNKRSVACGCDEDFNPSNDIAAAWEVEQKIGTMGKNIRDEYILAIHDVVGHQLEWDSSIEAEWAILRASPEQRCLAALRAVGRCVLDAEAKP